MNELVIRVDDLQGQEIRAFLRDHLANMREITPLESVHALDVDGLRAPGITFWSAWAGSQLVGCGALREIDGSTGEIKSMRTDPACRGRGIGSRMLRHLLDEAEARGYRLLLLETGAMPEFEPARALYRRHGFRLRGPFPPYREDPNSVYMEMALSGRAT